MRRPAVSAVIAAVACFIVACVPSSLPRGRYAFHDEFDGTTLDLNKWQPNWLGPDDAAVTKPVNGAEASCYDPGNVAVGGGYLHLRAERRPCLSWPYASGLVNSHDSFTFTTGYLEARVWLSGSTQIENWPAVWTDGFDWPNTGESDVMEGLNGRACCHYHSASGSQGGCAQGDFTGWHTYAERVTNDATTYYYDRGTRRSGQQRPRAALHHPEPRRRLRRADRHAEGNARRLREGQPMSVA